MKSGTLPYDNQETETTGLHSQDMKSEKSPADHSLMPPNLTDSEYESEYDSGSDSEADIHTHACASSGMRYKYEKNGTLFYDGQEKETTDFHSQDINMEKSPADHSLMLPNLTDSEYDSEYNSGSDSEVDIPEGHLPGGSNSPASIYMTTETSVPYGHQPLGRASDLRPTTFTDPEDEPETGVKANDTRDLPNRPSDLLHWILDKEGTGLYTHKSKINPLDRIQTEHNQPSGTGLSRTRINEAMANYEDTTLDPLRTFSKDHETATKKECATDPYEEETVQSHKLALPDLIESEAESDFDSEMEQDFSIERTCHHTYNADGNFEKEGLDIFQPSGMIQNPRKQCMTKTSGTDKAEVEYMNRKDDSK